MIRDALYSQVSAQPLHQSNSKMRSLETAQETIYEYFLELVKTQPVDQVLYEFQRFFLSAESDRPLVAQALYSITLSNNNEQVFRYTLKRSCYILINNWETVRQYDAIQKLVDQFHQATLLKYTLSATLRRLRTWINNFLHSEDFQEIELFAKRFTSEREPLHWKHRFNSFLLASQYANLQNSVEQRKAAKQLARKLKEQFKFNLAMYVAHSQSNPLRNNEAQNPTTLGNEALLLVKTLAIRRGSYSYANLARLFVEQTKQLCYEAFKSSFINYLTFSLDNQEVSKTLKFSLSRRLMPFLEEHNLDPIYYELVLKTCKYLIGVLTIEEEQTPSPLFISLTSQSNPLILAILLLKIILICKRVRTYLEVCIANLIQYYEKMSPDDCQWVVHFLEVLNVALAIHADNVEYSLVRMQDPNAMQENRPFPGSSQPDLLEDITDTEGYRVFSQLRSGSSKQPTPVSLG